MSNSRRTSSWRSEAAAVVAAIAVDVVVAAVVVDAAGYSSYPESLDDGTFDTKIINKVFN